MDRFLQYISSWVPIFTWLPYSGTTRIAMDKKISYNIIYVYYEHNCIFCTSIIALYYNEILQFWVLTSLKAVIIISQVPVKQLPRFFTKLGTWWPAIILWISIIFIGAPQNWYEASKNDTCRLSPYQVIGSGWFKLLSYLETPQSHIQTPPWSPKEKNLLLLYMLL